MNHESFHRFPQRLGVLLGIGAVAVATAGADSLVQGAQVAPLPPITSYRSASCGCCKGWVQHLRANGFQVNDAVITDVDVVRRRLGVPTRLASCHSAKVAGYVLEGHVPAADVKRLLRSHPPVAGLAVPGMVLGSPGMESTTASEPYSVLAFSSTGRTSGFSRQIP